MDRRQDRDVRGASRRARLRSRKTGTLLVTLAAGALPLTAAAGGFDRGRDLSLLFDDRSLVLDYSTTHVAPNRRLEAIERDDNVLPIPGAPVLTTRGIDADIEYTVPNFGLKIGLTPDVDCLLSYTEPNGADAAFGLGNAHSPTGVDFSIETEDYGATCAFSRDVGEIGALGTGRVRLLFGLSWQEFTGKQTRQSLLDVANTLGPGPYPFPFTGVDPAGTGAFELSDEAVGWRLGVAFEIPAIALRAVLLYNSEYDFDGLEGTVDTTGFAGPASGVFPTRAALKIPHSLGLELQSGITQRMLAFAKLRWQNWSELDTIPIEGVINPIAGVPEAASFDPLFRDGWNASFGVARQFTPRFAGLVSLNWDRGTSTFAGFQTDALTINVGGSLQVTDRVEVRLGGAVGYLDDGTSQATGFDAANNVRYSFDRDRVAGISLSVRWNSGRSRKPMTMPMQNAMPEETM